MAEDKLKDSPEPPPAVPDSILLRLELDEQATVPTVMDELQKELQQEVSRPLEENMAGDGPTEDTGADREALQASLGQRKMREIILERYSSQGNHAQAETSSSTVQTALVLFNIVRFR